MKSGMRELIMIELRRKRKYESELSAYHLLLAIGTPQSPSAHIQKVMLKTEIINAWLCILPTSYMYVVRRHLIDGVQWNHIAFEHSVLFGCTRERSVRTLVRYQTKAITMIENFAKIHRKEYIETFSA